MLYLSLENLILPISLFNRMDTDLEIGRCVDKICVWDLCAYTTDNYQKQS